jgi:tRNA threonylcarbamoyladenosine biosynthesis protein TsaB
LRILGFDTATRATTAALCDFQARPPLELEARDDPPPGKRPAHATCLLPLITELLERAGGGWEDIDRIAVGVGPGTFTGLRIGIATARALARAREIGLVGVSTLRSLALGAQRHSESLGDDGPTAVLAAIDARRREVFGAAWGADGHAAEPLIAPAAFAPQALASAVAALDRTVLAVGDGAVEFRAALERPGVLIPEDDSRLHRVTAINHCRLAYDVRPSDPDQISPQYLRLPDAELARRGQSTK